MISKLSEKDLMLLKQKKEASSPPKEAPTLLSEKAASPETFPDAPPPLQDVSKYHPLAFEDPLDMLFFFDENIRTGLIKLHSWQIEDLILISKKGYTIAEPLFYYLRAANGSGKDAYIIAPICLFLLLTRIRTRIITTSSSSAQLQGQTENYIRNRGFAINTKLQEQGVCESGPLIIKKGHVVNSLTGSEIRLFSTDEPGRAEGYHPFPDMPGSELCIIINEAKSVPKDIFDALSRCTFNRWLEISSTGGASGHFYDHCQRAKPREAPYDPLFGVFRKTTSYDCSHISRVKIERDKQAWGESSWLFRSKHLAEFTSLDDTVVFPEDVINKCKSKDVDKPQIKLGILRIGTDLAGGGNENSQYAYDGNVRVFEDHWISANTPDTARRICANYEKLKAMGYKIEGSTNCLDDGGIGQAIIDMVVEQGYEVSRIKNQSAAIWAKQFGNRGAEMYFNVKRLAELGFISLDESKDSVLIEQLSKRRFKDLAKVYLESKKDAIASGRSSPDRADAFVLTFCRVRPSDFTEKSGVIETTKNLITQQEIVEQMERQKFSMLYNFRGEATPGNICHPSNVLQNFYEDNY